MCPVECEVSPWLPWKRATSRAVTAFRRSRTVQWAEDGGKPCPKLRDTKVCNMMECPVDCAMTEWKCGACAKTCGGSSKVCTRVVRPASQGGRVAARSLKPCTATCRTAYRLQLSVGTPTPCTKSCGGGKRGRRNISTAIQCGAARHAVRRTKQSCATSSLPYRLRGYTMASLQRLYKDMWRRQQDVHKNITIAAEHGGIACPQGETNIRLALHHALSTASSASGKHGRRAARVVLARGLAPGQWANSHCTAVKLRTWMKRPRVTTCGSVPSLPCRIGGGGAAAPSRAVLVCASAPDCGPEHIWRSPLPGLDGNGYLQPQPCAVDCR